MPVLTDTLAAVTVYGTRVAVTSGVVDAAAVTVFTEGHCHHLALALHRRTGWPLWVLIDAGNSWMSIHDRLDVRRAADAGRPVPDEYLANLWAHVLVRRPDGLLVDIHGPRDTDTVLAHYDGIGQLDPEPGTVGLHEANIRSRLVPATAEQVAALVSTAPPAPGLADRFVDAVLTLEQTQTFPWPWEHTLADDVDAQLGQARENAADDGAEFTDYAADYLRDLDESHNLLSEALTRGMLPTELRSLACDILDDVS